MLADKLTRFEKDYHRKKFYRENNLNQMFVYFLFFSSFLIVLCSTLLKSVFVANFAWCDLSLDIIPKYLLKSLGSNH